MTRIRFNYTMASQEVHKELSKEFRKLVGPPACGGIFLGNWELVGGEDFPNGTCYDVWESHPATDKEITEITKILNDYGSQLLQKEIIREFSVVSTQ